MDASQKIDIYATRLADPKLGEAHPVLGLLLR